MKIKICNTVRYALVAFSRPQKSANNSEDPPYIGAGFKTVNKTPVRPYKNPFSDKFEHC